MRQKRLKRFQNDSASSDSSLSMAPITFGKNNKGKGKAKAGGMNGLSLKEQRNMSGTPDPVFNPVGYALARRQVDQSLTLVCRT